MPGFGLLLRRALVVLLPALALGCPGDDTPQDGTDSELDSSGDALTTTGVDTVGTTTATTGMGPGTATTGMGPGTATTPPDTDTATTLDGTDTDEPPRLCPSVGVGELREGEACVANDECFSGVCTLYTDAPPDLEAICDETPLDCSMRVTATAVDIVTRQTPAGVDVVIASALEAGTDPVGADPLWSTTTDENGRIDGVLPEPPNATLGLVALLSAPSYELSATGLAAPLDGMATYGVANEIHDLWLVSTNAVNAWSNMLALDPSIPPEALPLVGAGGVVGLVRDAAGLPLAGATVTSLDGGSTAHVRYLAGDGTFNTNATGDLGLFVILEPALAEGFEAEVGGTSLGTGTAGSAAGAVFTLVFTAP